MEFSLGLIEVEALGHAVFVLDAMTKAADVEFVATERRLGGRLVTLVVKGNVSAVSAAVDAGKEVANEFGCLKAAEVIARPHTEILKFLHLDEGDKKEPAPKKETDKAVDKVKQEKKESKTVKAVSDKGAPKKSTKKTK